MHRLMLTSNTYRQSTENPDYQKYAEIDSKNRLLWRMNWLRLEGETIRDSVLAVNGQLQKSEGGPGVFVSVPADVASGFEFFKWFPSDEKEQARRTIYTFQRRSVMNPMIEVFDGANMSEVCSRRSATVVPTQAFTLLNSEFINTGAKHFAERVIELAGSDRDKELDKAFELTLGRTPSPKERQKMYGMDDPVTESFGKRCLMARKMVEKGVRFVQLYTPSQSWDGHTEIVKNHTKNAAETDKPIAALLKDLKQRGLLDSTLVVWMGEFGRTPDNPADLRDKAGRDHNTRAMTIWFAGGGTKPGTLVGATDDLGFKAVQDIYRMRDVHATILHLMGLNNLQLTYYSAGRNQRLTDTGGTVIKQVLA
jgi:hypothetical protein